MTKTFPLEWVLAIVIVSRLAEMMFAARNTRRLKAELWREVGAGHYPLFILLHVSFLAAIASTTPLDHPPIWPLVGVLGVLQILRFWTIASLGREWTTKIMTCDAAPLTAAGPYRFIRHPAYTIVSIEVLILPLTFGDWPVALVWSALNLALLRHRISAEELAIAARRVAKQSDYRRKKKGQAR